MYTAYWNLNCKPFQNVPDANFAYLSDQHREGFARLLYLVDGRKLGGIVAGPYGVGKSMILELLNEELKQRPGVRYLRVDATPAGTLPLVRTITRRLGYKERVEDVSEALYILEDICSEGNSDFEHLVLAVDEAQMFIDGNAYVFMHLLTNLRVRRKDGSYGDPAATLLLSGHQQVIEAVCQDPSLCQRLQITWELSPLDEDQTVEYVHFRIRRAGGDIWMFEREALGELYRASGGMPRVINNVCDVCLVIGCSNQESRITRDVMLQAIAEVRPANDLAGEGE